LAHTVEEAAPSSCPTRLRRQWWWRWQRGDVIRHHRRVLDDALHPWPGPVGLLVGPGRLQGGGRGSVFVVVLRGRFQAGPWHVRCPHNFCTDSLTLRIWWTDVSRRMALSVCVAPLERARPICLSAQLFSTCQNPIIGPLKMRLE
jgi:hypothetical protein